MHPALEQRPEVRPSIADAVKFRKPPHAWQRMLERTGAESEELVDRWFILPLSTSGSNVPKSKTDWTWFQRGEIDGAIRTCRELLRSGLLSGVYPRAVEQASLCWLLINLNDLLQKLDSAGYRVVFANDIHPACKATDITTLINNARNAVCHLNSGNHLLDANKLTYNVFRGFVPNGISVDGVVFGSHYPDDTAVLFGSNLVYLRRHIGQALDAVERFVRLVDFQG